MTLQDKFKDCPCILLYIEFKIYICVFAGVNVFCKKDNANLQRIFLPRSFSFNVDGL
jgi:hypothetical protein